MFPRVCWLVIALFARLPLATAQDSSTLADEEAHRLFEAGRVAFAAGRNEAALADFEQAYELSHRPNLLYNIAQCDDRLRRDEAALHAFQQYLALAGDAPNRLEVEARIDVLSDAIARHAEAVAPPISSEPPIEADPIRDVPAPAGTTTDATGAWVLFASSAGVLIAGAIVLALGEVDRASVESAPDGTLWTRVTDAYGRAPVLEGIGIAALALGALGTAIGLAWALTPSGSAQTASIRLEPGSLTIAGTF